jgi:N-acetylmuramoyl-L-alanine amidase
MVTTGCGGARPPSPAAVAPITAASSATTRLRAIGRSTTTTTAPTRSTTTPPTTTVPTTTVPVRSTTTASPTAAPPITVPPTTRAPTTEATTAQPIDGAPPAIPESADGGPATLAPTGRGDLKGKIVAVDPGHNGDNYEDPAVVNAPIFNGREVEACDTTGTETDGGYTEAQFNFNVAAYLTADLRALGATVVLTRTSNTGVGPCVTDRAAIGNAAHADVAVSIHADGGPPGGRGFTVLEPVADGPNDAIIAPSDMLATDLRDVFGAATGTAVSDYYGVDGLQPRDDLGGLNLSTVPKVLIETANMRNAADARLVTSPAWQALAAKGIAIGLSDFLLGRPGRTG